MSCAALQSSFALRLASCPGMARQVTFCASDASGARNSRGSRVFNAPQMTCQQPGTRCGSAAASACAPCALCAPSSQISQSGAKGGQFPLVKALNSAGPVSRGYSSNHLLGSILSEAMQHDRRGKGSVIALMPSIQAPALGAEWSVHPVSDKFARRANPANRNRLQP